MSVVHMTVIILKHAVNIKGVQRCITPLIGAVMSEQQAINLCATVRCVLQVSCVLLITLYTHKDYIVLNEKY